MEQESSMQISSNEISIVERQTQLHLAYEQYLRGQISVEQLEEVERRYILPFFHEPVERSTWQFFNWRSLKQAVHNLMRLDKHRHD